MADDDFSQFEVSGPIRVMSEWVPGEPKTHATQFGPDEKPLVAGASAAVSPNLSEGHELHEPFEVYQNGKLVGQYSFDDHSYYSPGNPTTNTIERYGLPDLGHGYTIKWLGKQAASDFGDYEKGADDFSKFEVSAQKQAPKDDFKQFEGLESNHPIAKQNGWTLGQTISNIWDVAKTHTMANALATAKQRVVQPVPDQIVQQQIDAIKASPYLTPEQQQQNIAAIQAGQTKEVEDAKASITRIQSELSQTEQSIKKNNPNAAEKVVGGVLPYLTSGVMGPLGPIQAAQQASAETYGEVLDSSTQRLKKMHPDWDDGRVVTQAVKAAAEASRGSGEAMLALSVVDVPGAGSTIARIAQKIGIGAATMEIANSFAEVQKNMALKANVDPKEDWLGQLRNIEFHVQNLATGGAFGGLHGLGGEIGRPSHVPIEDRVPIAEVPETKEEPTPVPSKEPESQSVNNGRSQDTPVTELPKEVSDKISLLGLDENNKVHRAIASLADKYDKQGIEKFVISAGKADDGQIIVSELGHGDVANKYSKQGGNPDDLRLGFVTNKGRFVRATENINMSGEAADVRDEARVERKEQIRQTVEQPPVTATEPWLSAIANRFVEPRVAAGEIGEVTPGKGANPQQMLAKGTAMGPEEIAQHVSDIANGKDPFDLKAAALRAEEGRLSQQSARLSRIAEANPNDPVAQRNSEEASQYVTDFHNGPIKKLKEIWSNAGKAMQGQIEIDYGSVNNLREQWLRDVGEEPNERVQDTMRKTARKVREAQAEHEVAMRRLGEEINKQSTRRKLPSYDEVRERILSKMNGDRPCGV